MRTGLITIDEGVLAGCTQADNTLARKINESGLVLVFNLTVSADLEELRGAIVAASSLVNQCFVTGNVQLFYEYAAELNLGASNVVVIDGVEFIVMQKYSAEDFEYVLPLITGKNKQLYNTAVFKTFGLSESAIKEAIGDYMKNRNRIMIRLYPSLLECDVVVRYGFKVSKMAVDEILYGIQTRLEKYIYSCEDISLAERAARLISYRNVSLVIAESFTGGLVTSELVKIAGASKYLFEGIVSYSNESKIRRLDVDPRLIKENGAVSIETVYQMAYGLLAQHNADIVIATTGNAGPSSEKPNEVGKCFTAVGTREQIQVLPHEFGNLSREQIMQCGAKCALNQLINLLNNGL